MTGETDETFLSGLSERPIHVVRLAARGVPNGLPVVMVHGGGHSGAAYVETPDGRPGWARRFAEAGRDVYVCDWPGHGLSPALPDFARLSGHEVAASLGVLLERIGRAVLLVHSASGPMAWRLAETHAHLVAGIVAIAPGPPANLVPVLPDDPAVVNALSADESAGCPVYSPLDRPVVFPRAFIEKFWANSPRFPKGALEAYVASIGPESPLLMNERFNIGGAGLAVKDPVAIGARPILVVTGEFDPRHPRDLDRRTADFFGAEFLYLPEAGIRDNGHMMMIEDNHLEIGGLILDWLAERGL